MCVYARTLKVALDPSKTQHGSMPSISTPMACVLCDDELDCPYGHNPMPVSKVGRCCFTCNSKVVVPTRFRLANPGEFCKDFGFDHTTATEAHALVMKFAGYKIDIIKAEKRAMKAEERKFVKTQRALMKAEESGQRKAQAGAKQVLMRRARAEEQRQRADEAAQTAAADATIARLSRGCVAAALDKMPVMAEARALDAAARRTAAALRELNVKAGVKAANAAKTAMEQRAEEALAKAGHTTKRARKRNKC